MVYLFSYGSLQEATIQLELFDRELRGWPDVVSGFVLSKEKAYGAYPILNETKNPAHRISGTVFELSEQELIQADVYEGEAYKRKLIELESGKRAWLYIAN
ncbi:gamma-glutamylcyclotransferase family protein [Pareuzebyella sediminis]|uniref:gamma-glutamylcyclotransferase family protein n=1 Tax=Pareuzebyella sediminis TaxID=2607998 RepID=UPI0011EEF532|nr:gamma-glutamylcyclotransferase family protein [Pareuzebyella sediminis]